MSSKEDDGARDLRRRKFKVQSEFGTARQWRSRKSRPCDVCRKRKTVCVITSVPPCLFCKERGLECTSSAPSTSAPKPPSVSHDAPHAPPPASSPSPGTPGLGTDGILTLDDNENRTAHSMGPAAEQDTHVLNSIRSGILSSPEDVDADMIQVYPGSTYPWDPPVHFCLLQDEFAAHDNVARETASRAIEDLVGQYGPILVRLYFKHIHPVLPILSKVRFLTQYSADKTKLPASLRGAVYALASVFWRSDPSLKGPFPFRQHQLADLANDSLQRELDSPNLAKLQASLLLPHVKPNDIDSIENPRTWTAAAQTVAIAQMIGLHQDAEKWRIPRWEKRLRRKLWWATYVADLWSAICHGNPPHLYPASFNTSAVTMEDLRSDEDVPEDLQTLVDPINARFQVATGARFLELVNISQMVRDLVDCSFQVPRLRPPEPHETTLPSRLLEIKERLGNWDALLPQCLAIPSPERAVGASNNAPLHLAFYAYLALLYRALMSPATNEMKKDPASSLRRWFRTALTEFGNFPKFIAALTSEDLQGFWGRHARSQLILCGNFLIYLFLMASELADGESAYSLIESFHGSLQRLEGQADSASKLLIRPVALRLNSFFIQAPELMRQLSSAEAASRLPANR